MNQNPYHYLRLSLLCSRAMSERFDEVSQELDQKIYSFCRVYQFLSKRSQLSKEMSPLHEAIAANKSDNHRIEDTQYQEKKPDQPCERPYLQPVQENDEPMSEIIAEARKDREFYRCLIAGLIYYSKALSRSCSQSQDKNHQCPYEELQKCPLRPLVSICGVEDAADKEYIVLKDKSSEI